MIKQNGIIIKETEVIKENEKANLGINYIIAHNELICSPYLTSNQMRVYQVLLMFKDCKKICPTKKFLLKACGISNGTLVKCLKTLNQLGLIKITKRMNLDGSFNTNLYEVINYIDWLKSSVYKNNKK